MHKLIHITLDADSDHFASPCLHIIAGQTQSLQHHQRLVQKSKHICDRGGDAAAVVLGICGVVVDLNGFVDAREERLGDLVHKGSHKPLHGFLTERANQSVQRRNFLYCHLKLNGNGGIEILRGEQRLNLKEV